MGSHVEETEFRGTPFNPCTAPLNLNQKWVAWDVYHVVDVFTEADDELRAIREAAALIDMSPLAKYEFSGRDSQRFVDYLITRDASGIEIGQILYTSWCDQAGKIVSDGMVFRIDEDRFRITGDPCLHWLETASQGFDVQIEDVTHRLAIASLQGPRSREVLEAAAGGDWSDLRFSRIRTSKIASVEVEVARQGFTGERGYEICVAGENAVPVWDGLMTAGRDFGIRPAGRVAADVARIEAGLIIPGPDYTKGGVSDERGSAIQVDEENKTSPYEVGLGRFVDLGKKTFLGKEALQEEARGGSSQGMVGLLIDWQDVAALFTEQSLPPVVVPTAQWYPSPAIREGRRVGRATSIVWSPSANSLVGFGFLERRFCEPGSTVSVEFHAKGKNGLARAIVTELPFLRRRRRTV